MLLARYSEESATQEVNTIKQYYRDACEMNKQWEDGHFHLAMYYDRILSSLDVKEKPVEWIHHIVLRFVMLFLFFFLSFISNGICGCNIVISLMF